MRNSNLVISLLACAITASALPAQCHAGAGTSGMPSAESRADELVSQMTLEEKIYYIGGTNWFYIRSIPRLGIPEIKMSDGPMAVRVDFPVVVPTTSYPDGIALAATWDPEMARKL